MRIGARLGMDQGTKAGAVRHVVNVNNKVGYIDNAMRKRKRSTGRTIERSRALPFSMALQELYLACRAVFKGPGTVPTHDDVRRLRHILDNMKPEDVGLSRDLQFFKPRSTTKVTQRVTSTTIYECNNFSLCIFFLPSGGIIPLHNHPGMTVFSKLLLGSIHVKSYDWVDPEKTQNGSTTTSKRRLAKVKADGILTAPCNSEVLYPTAGGNIHAVTAITPSAFLDVLGPPYSNKDGRDCSYYKDSPYTESSNEEGTVTKGESYGWLEEIEMPENSQMDTIKYRGPQIIETSC